jgi:hypothetical protein
MDATNGAKLARLIYMAAEKGIPLIGMNDAATSRPCRRRHPLTDEGIEPFRADWEKVRERS